MTEAQKWAQVILVAESLQGRQATARDDARVLVERATGSVMVGAGPIEVFSNQLPVYSGQPGEADLSPIDVLYGRYSATEVKIEIFVDRIRQDAPRFNAEFPDLLAIVRMHEYAHAVVHTGINSGEIAAQLGKLSQSGTTDWKSFHSDRDAAFAALDEPSHELLAQAITWACLSQGSVGEESQRLINNYLALERQQPSIYQLPDSVKEGARLADWHRVLQAARGNLRAYPGASFAIPGLSVIPAEGLAELMMMTAAGAAHRN